MGRPRRRPAARAFGILGWAGAVVAAGWIAWWAVAVVGEQAGGGHDGVLTQEQAEAYLGAAATAPPTSSPAGPTDPPAATSSAPTASPTTAGEVARTWAVTGGRAGAACYGESITLLFATPEEGWSVEAVDPGPDRVEVEFRRGEAETGLRAECRDGVPVLVDSSDDD